jgi:DNA-directed RNA polymerase specialized sigma24 family protein
MAGFGKSRERFVLDSAVFDRFLGRLDADRETAANKYMALYRKLEVFFQVRRCEPDTGTLCDTTLNRVMQHFFDDPALDSADPQAYALGVARYVVLEHWKKPPTVELKVDPVSPAASGAEDQEIQRCLSMCLKELPEAERELAIRYYTYEKRQKSAGRRETAQSAERSQGAIRIKLYRIRKTLKRCIEKRLQGKRQ